MKRATPKKAAGNARNLKNGRNPKKPARPAAGRAMAARRADYGAPIDGFFRKQAPELRVILGALRDLVAEAAPDAVASIKWGMPFFTIGGATVCALASFKSHVNLILPGAPGSLADPERLLEGEGTTGRHLKLRALEELPREHVRRWLRTTTLAARREAEGSG